MSDTPRTDAEAFYPHDSNEKVCDAVFARQLEGELNAANSEVERLTRKVAELYEGADEQRQEIKSLRNQIDRMIGWKNEKDRQLCNLLNICRSNGIEVSSQDLLGRDGK
jgi:septal ring factor EnvC (AmiA/AmiB activator)